MESFKSCFCISSCDLDSLVTQKAQILALSQEMLLSNAPPNLAATGKIQICLGLESREKTGVLLSSNGGYLPLPVLTREETL